MKKIVFLIVTVLFITSCEKDKIGSTATEKMAGEWYVIADAIDADGNVVYEDPFGLGRFHLDTYNTSSNSTTEMWINDNENFIYSDIDDSLIFKTKINVDLSLMTFQATDAQNEYRKNKNQVTITGGKIMYGAATTPSGMPADSIVFTLSLSSDTLPATYGYAKYRIAGFRYTGFTADE